MKKQKIALFHPWIKSRGGAEKVVLELANLKDFDVDIYTWVYEPEKTFEEFKQKKIRVIAPSFAKNFSRSYLLRGIFLPLCLFSKIPLEKYDKFLISTSGIGEFITFRNYKKGKTFAYVHTPLRDANKKIIKWNLKSKYSSFSFKKLVYLFFVKIYGIFEKVSWKKLDFIIFNSGLSLSRAEEKKLMNNRQKKYVVFPPVDLSRLEKLKTESGNSFVYVSRLNSPKRQDLLIKAWKKLSEKVKDYKLILVGNVENEKYYMKLLKLSENDPSIEIKTSVGNKELEEIIRKAKTGIFLGYQEDFGITPLEIIGAGKPLIAVDEGGYVDLIKNNNLFFKLRERTTEKEMVEEIYMEIGKFLKNSNKKIKKEKIILPDFKKEIGRILKNG